MEKSLKIGSKAHKELFCQSFLDNHKQFEPEKDFKVMYSVSLSNVK